MTQDSQTLQRIARLLEILVKRERQQVADYLYELNPFETPPPSVREWLSEADAVLQGQDRSTDEGPWPALKLAGLRADGKVRCQAVDRHILTQEQVQCGLIHGHTGPHAFVDGQGDVYVAAER